MFIDYNLYGMNMLNVAAVKFRRQNRDGNYSYVTLLLFYPEKLLYIVFMILP